MAIFHHKTQNNKDHCIWTKCKVVYVALYTTSRRAIYRDYDVSGAN